MTQIAITALKLLPKFMLLQSFSVLYVFLYVYIKTINVSAYIFNENRLLICFHLMYYL